MDCSVSTAVPAVPLAQNRFAAGARRRDKMTDAGLRKLTPRELLAGIDLAARRDIGMGKHAMRRDAVAVDDAPAEADDRIDLPAAESRDSRIRGRD